MALSPPYKPEAQTYYNKGITLYRQQRHQEAVDMLEQAVEIDPTHHEALGLLGKITRENGYISESIECYALAIRANDNVGAYQKAFIELIAFHSVTKFNEELKDLILRCLHAKEIDVAKARLPWYGMLMKDPAFRPLSKLMDKKSYDAFESAFLKLKDCSVLAAPYLTVGLSKLLICKMPFEHLMTYLRRFFCHHHDSDKNPLKENETLEFLSALACYAHGTDYIFATTKAELEKVETLKNNIQTGKHEPWDVALYACYAPLTTLDNGTVIANHYKSSKPLDRIMDLQIAQMEEHNSIEKAVPALTKITDSVSGKVREQYEIFPYPRWSSYDQDIKNEKTESFLRDGKPDILVAGCGTGKEAIELAHVFPNAHVLAIDLSRNSLAYGIRQARLHGINNIDFRQADILELGTLDQRFDYIASSGVLHHMDKPEEGLRILAGLLKSGGTMRLAFYSRRARHAINKTRDVIQKNEIGRNDQAIRNFRAGIKDYVDKKTFENISSFADYFNLNECRDLLFHVQEHQYDLLQIKEMLTRNGLEFSEFYLPEDTLKKYGKMFPQDTERKNLDLWAKFEEREPDTFKEMFRFWCVKT